MKIALCIPHYGGLEPLFVASAMAMVGATMGTLISYRGKSSRPEMTFAFAGEGATLDLKRAALVNNAIASGAEYILFLDSDHRFPADALLRLLGHQKPIVGCNYPTRLPPLRPSAIALDGNPLYTTKEKADAGELEEVGAVGLGLCLIYAPVLKRLQRPLFATHTDATGCQLMESEDVHFCNQARAAGVPVFVDHSLSWEIGHIAQIVRTNSDITPSSIA